MAIRTLKDSRHGSLLVILSRLRFKLNDMGKYGSSTEQLHFRQTVRRVSHRRVVARRWPSDVNNLALPKHTTTPGLMKFFSHPTCAPEEPVTNNDPFNYTPIRLRNLADKIIEKRYRPNSIRVTGLANLLIESALSHALSNSVGDVLIGK